MSTANRSTFTVACITLLLLALQGQGSAQNFNPNSLSNIIPPSPEVASLGKYLDIPVGYQTGTAQVGVPIYKVTNGNLAVDIALSYHTGGIKVAEAPTWVGMGWNLNAGGSLSRVVRGQPDDISNGYMYVPSNKKVAYIHNLSISSGEYIDLMYNQVQGGDLDIEPDQYFFSVMGHSGTFYYSQDSGRFITAPYQQLKIEHNSGTLTAWTLTFPDGVKAYFGTSLDGTRTASEKNLTNQTISSVNGVESPGGTSPYQGISSWPVMDITAPTSKAIHFYYTADFASDFGRGGEKKDVRGISGCDYSNQTLNSSVYIQSTVKPVLQKISSDNADVFFIRSQSARQDVLDTLYSQSLDSILVQDKHGNRVRVFAFGYGYFTSGDAPVLAGLESATQVARKRLYLKTFTEYDPAASLAKPYRFYYDSTVYLPSRLSSSQDFWGYYNGANNYLNNYSLIPKVLVRAANNNYHGPGYMDGADRTVNFSYARAGSLVGILYPTGGTATMEYEPNLVQTSGTGQADVLNGYQFSGMTDGFLGFNKQNAFQQADPNTYSEDFTVGSSPTDVVFIMNMTNCGDVAMAGCPVQLTITGVTNPSFFLAYQQTGTFSATLPAGAYKITAVLNPDPDINPDPDFSVTGTWQETPAYLVNNLLVGGLRIKSIKQADGMGDTLYKTLSYQQFGDSATSSGMLVNLPVPIYRTYCGNTEEIYPSIGLITAGSEVPLTTGGGDMLTYANVTEYYDSKKSSFKTQYTYSVYHDGITPANTNYPFPKNVYADWRSGILQQKDEFEKLGDGSYRPVSTEKNFFTNYETTPNIIAGCGTAPEMGPGSFSFTYYTFRSEWFVPDSSISTAYDYSSGAVKTQTVSSKNLYNPSYDINSVRTTDSKGRPVEQKTWYTYDYSDVPGYNLGTLQSSFIRSPVKSESYVNGNITGGSVTKYSPAGLPLEVYTYEGGPGHTAPAHDAGTVVEPDYVLNTSVLYDAGGNPVQTVVRSGSPTSYLWGYNSQYPVAKVTGSSYATVSGMVSQSTLDNATGYGDDASVRSALSPLLGIGGGLATLYTYRPLTGISSQTDPGGRTTYYEYDGLGRPTLVRDQENYILKRYCYSYYNQAGACPASPSTITNVILGGGHLSCEDNWLMDSALHHLAPSVGTQKQRCINDILVTGAKAYLSSVYDPSLGKWICSYWYVFPDGAHSSFPTNDTSATSCLPPYLACDSASCAALEGHMCIGGNCETGVKVYDGSAYSPATGLWQCGYHYEFSDGSWSAGYTESSSSDCMAGTLWACNSATCSGIDRKCIDGICEIGVMVVVGQNGSSIFYDYEWSDGSVSPTYSQWTGGPGGGDQP